MKYRKIFPAVQTISKGANPKSVNFQKQELKTGEPMIDLRVTLAVENTPYYFNVRRVIYKTFIDRCLDCKKFKLYIINIDCNGYDNRPENLKAVTHTEKQLRAVNRDRVLPSILKTADRSNWKKNYSTSKPVAQYDLEGGHLQVSLFS